jgi:hypothetical protein
MMHHPCRLLILVAALISNADAAPLRILYLGTGEQTAADHCHILMRDLGRDAIWFDYLHQPGDATADWMRRFDAVLLDAPAGRFPALASVPVTRVVTLQFPDDPKSADDAFLRGAREKLLAAVSPNARRQWEAFLPGR